MNSDSPNTADIELTFTQIVRRSFVLNGKRHTVEHPTIPAGKYKLVALKDHRKAQAHD